jgi:hypothetical protein
MDYEFNYKYDNPSTKDNKKPDVIVRTSKGFSGWSKAKGYTIKEFLELLKVEINGDPEFVKKLLEGDVLLDTYNDYYKEQEEDRNNQMMGY